jgi:hypothetical protein
MVVMFGLAKNAVDALDETTVSMNAEERRCVAFGGVLGRSGHVGPRTGAPSLRLVRERR